MDQLIRETQPPAGTLRSPVPQYWNPDTEKYERVLGVHGAPRAMLYGPNGQPISTSNRLPVDVGGQIHADVDLGDVTVEIAEVQQGKRGQNAEPWEVTLKGSFVPYITSQVLAESLEVAAGATVGLPGQYQVLCEYITVGVLQVGSSDYGNLTVIVRPVVGAGWVVSKEVKAIDNVPMTNVRWLSDRVPVLADRVVIALQNHASVTRTFTVWLNRLGVGANV